jgi:hypothetical protein
VPYFAICSSLVSYNTGGLDLAECIRSLDSRVHDYILNDLRLCEQRTIQQTCKDAAAVVQNFWGRAYKVEPLLNHFFVDVIGFISLQRSTGQFANSHSLLRFNCRMTGAIISGSQAVHFFDRTIPDSGSDLDIYVEHRYVYP